MQEMLEKGAVSAARDLIGWRLYVQDGGNNVGGIIVETEAYTEDDAASHSYRGRTPRTEIMFGPAGYLYVYFTYGMHWCMNIVTSHEGYGEAVLIRAIRPDKGLSVIKERRNNRPDHELTDGPAKICQALDVTGVDSGSKLNESRFLLLSPTHDYDIEATRRIGISKDMHRLWRFVAKSPL